MIGQEGLAPRASTAGVEATTRSWFGWSWPNQRRPSGRINALALPFGCASINSSVDRGEADDLTSRQLYVVLATLIALVVARVALAASVDLSEDEAYYWLWSRHLAGGYYDHPPMVAYWIRLGTELIGPSPLGVRLLGLIATTAISWLLFETSRALFQSRAIAWQSVLWLNAGLLVNAAAIISTPDTPLAFFWVLTLFALAKLIETDSGKWWLLAGAAVGGAMLSKYTAAFLAPALLLWMSSSPQGRKWFVRPEPYLAGCLALAMFAPVVLWNYDHGWISFAKQAAHSVKDVPSNGFASMGEFLGGQAGLATPLIFGFCLFGGTIAVRRGFLEGDCRWQLLAATSVPIFIFFLLHAFNQKIQPNWPGFLYPSAVIATVAAIHELRQSGKLAAWAHRTYTAAAPVGLVVTAAVFAHLAFGIIPVAPAGDPTSRTQGWADLADQIEKMRAERGAGFIATNNYGLTALVAHRTGNPEQVLQINERVRYAFAPPVDGMRLQGQSALLFFRKGSARAELLQKFFDKIEFAATLERRSHGRVAMFYDAYFASNYRGGLF